MIGVLQASVHQSNQSFKQSNLENQLCYFFFCCLNSFLLVYLGYNKDPFSLQLYFADTRKAHDTLIDQTKRRRVFVFSLFANNAN